MFTLPIYLVTDEDDNLKRLGIDTKPDTEPKMALLHLRSDQIVGFWVEPEVDKNGHKDVVVYTSFDSFLCPYTKELEEKLKSEITPSWKPPWVSFPRQPE